jgi:hypothetical protein
MSPALNGVPLDANGVNGVNGSVPVETATLPINGTKPDSIPAVNVTSQVQTQITLGGKIIASANLPPEQP